MKIKILVISFCAFLFSFFIYSVYSDSRLFVLSLGDELALGATPFNFYGDGYNDFLKNFLNKNDIVSDYNDYFISGGETYESMVHKFDEDYVINVKDKDVSLRQSIAKADVIIISLSHEKTFDKCSNSKSNFISYIDSYFSNLNMFIDKVNKISVADMVVIGMYCYDYNEEINQYITELASNLDSKVKYINLYKDIHDSNFYLPNKKSFFPSLEGYDFIFKKIVFEYSFFDKNSIRG